MLRFTALGYLAVILILPMAWIIWKAFGGGIGDVWAAATQPYAVHALELSLLLALIAVAVNTVFGVVTALMIVRHPFPGVSLVNAFVDLPLGLSPVVIGLSLFLVYGVNGWFGPWLTAHGFMVMFAFPVLVLATTFVTLPFVVREVVPVVREVGTQQEEAARTLGASALQTFWRITLPSIRAGVIYGVVLTMARALGEFGTVVVVSGNIPGITQTLTQYVESEFEIPDLRAAYVASVELAAAAILTLVILNLTRRRGAAAE
jgi:sulfate/thiosulfate transport system permease protein